MMLVIYAFKICDPLCKNLTQSHNWYFEKYTFPGLFNIMGSVYRGWAGGGGVSGGGG